MRTFRPRRVPDLVVIEPAVHSDGRGILLEAWDEPTIRVDWPTGEPILSEADSYGSTLSRLAKQGLLPEISI